MRFLLLSVFISTSLGIDVVIESLKQLIDKKTDPCENFYRHACPLGSPSSLMIDMITDNLKENSTWAIPQNLEILNDENTHTSTQTINIIADLYRNVCKKGNDTGDLLLQIQKILHEPEQKYSCIGYSCVHQFKDDPDCERVAKQLENVLREYEWKIERLYSQGAEHFMFNYFTIGNISAHFDNNLEEGIEQTKEMIDRMKEIVEKMIFDTPWAQNHNASEMIATALKTLNLKSDIAKTMNNSIKVLEKTEQSYRKCKSDYDNDNNSDIFCFILVSKNYLENLKEEPTMFFEILVNAFNMFPFVRFGMPLYYMAKNTEERAAKLGSVGFVAGHEVSHTLIQDDTDFVLTYFSENATKCVQDQYVSTCKEFKEKDCKVYNSQVDENGSDILGLQLAYKLLEEEYGDRLKDTYKPLNVTYQQLFFYANIPFFCDGEKGDIVRGEDGKRDVHSPNYIRMNAMVNHPAFQEAFQCSEDSRMMKSATKQCIIYGEGAPQNKRFR